MRIPNKDYANMKSCFGQLLTDTNSSPVLSKLLSFSLLLVFSIGPAWRLVWHFTYFAAFGWKSTRALLRFFYNGPEAPVLFVPCVLAVTFRSLFLKDSTNPWESRVICLSWGLWCASCPRRDGLFNPSLTFRHTLIISTFGHARIV